MAKAPPSPSTIPADELVRMIQKQESSIAIQKRFTSQTISGDVVLSDLEYPTSLIIHGAVFLGEVVANGMRFDRDVDLRSCHFKKSLSMIGCQFGGDVDLSGAHVDESWSLQSATIRTNLLCRRQKENDPRPEIGQDLILLGATIGGQVDLNGIWINGKLSAESCKVTGCFFAFTSDRYAMATEIGGDVLFNGSTLEGETLFLGAKIDGSFQAVRATFDDGLFLGCGNHFYDEGYRGSKPTKVGPVDLSHSRIGGSLHLRGTQIVRNHKLNTGPVPRPDVNLSFADVTGDCRLIDDGTTTETLNLDHGTFGNLTIVGGSLPRITADGLAFRRLQLPGNDPLLFLDRTIEFHKSIYRVLERYFSEQGRDDLADMIHREMIRRDRRQEVGTPLVWLDVIVFELLGEYIWFRQPRLDRARSLVRLAQSDRGKKTVPFVQSGWMMQFWLVLTLAVYQFGPEWSALIPGLFLLLSVGRLARWVWSIMLDVTTGCGTASQRLGIYLAVVFTGLTILFLNPVSVRYATTANTIDVRTALTKQAQDAEAYKLQLEPALHPRAEDWGLPEAAFTSVRVTLPMVTLLATRQWEPSHEPVSSAPSWLKYNTLAGWVSLVSYIAVPLFLASVTGFLKKRGD